MAYAKGSQQDLRYVPEVTWGTTPGTPAMKRLRSTGNTLGIGKNTVVSAELRSDRQITDFRHGNKQARGDVNFELSYLAQEALLESAFMAAFATTYNVSTLAVAAAATPKTYTRSTGSYITEGVKVGDKVTWSGFVSAGNNGVKTVVTVTALVMTVSEAGMVDEAAGGNEAYTTTHMRLKPGATLKSLSIERAHVDLTKYMLFTGMACSRLSLSIKPDQIVTGAASLVGKDLTIGASSLGTPTDVGTTAPFMPNIGSIKEAGTAIAIVTGLDLTIDNNLQALFALFDASAKGLADRRCNVTGTLTAYLIDDVLINKWLNETETSLEFILTDLSAQSYRITLPRLKYSAGDAPVNGEEEVILSLPFQAIMDTTLLTNIIIDRLS